MLRNRPHLYALYPVALDRILTQIDTLNLKEVLNLTESLKECEDSPEQKAALAPIKEKVGSMQLLRQLVAQCPKSQSLLLLRKGIFLSQDCPEVLSELFISRRNDFNKSHITTALLNYTSVPNFKVILGILELPQANTSNLVIASRFLSVATHEQVEAYFKRLSAAYEPVYSVNPYLSMYTYIFTAIRKWNCPPSVHPFMESLQLYLASMLEEQSADKFSLRVCQTYQLLVDYDYVPAGMAMLFVKACIGAGNLDYKHYDCLTRLGVLCDTPTQERLRTEVVIPMLTYPSFISQKWLCSRALAYLTWPNNEGQHEETFERAFVDNIMLDFPIKPSVLSEYVKAAPLTSEFHSRFLRSSLHACKMQLSALGDKLTIQQCQEAYEAFERHGKFAATLVQRLKERLDESKQAG